MENGAVASANTQKTDPVLEPKFKVVDWDKVAGLGWRDDDRELPGLRRGCRKPKTVLCMTVAQGKMRTGWQMLTAHKCDLEKQTWLGLCWVQAVCAKRGPEHPSGSLPPELVKLRRARRQGQQAQTCPA